MSKPNCNCSCEHECPTNNQATENDVVSIIIIKIGAPYCRACINCMLTNIYQAASEDGIFLGGLSQFLALDNQLSKI